MNKQCAIFVAAVTMSFVSHADGDSWSLFAGADYVMHEVSITDTVAAPSAEPPGDNSRTERLDGDGSSVRLRVGMWLNEDFSVELQGNVSSDGLDGVGSAEIDSYYGVFISPRAQPFDWLDMTFPIGFTSIDAFVTDNGTTADNQPQVRTVSGSNEGIAFGLNFNVRLGELLSDPDSIIAGLGVGAGFMVYNSSDNVNVRGYNAGLQFGMDF
ncbi:MAG: hypothetical protein ACSHXK_05815 [Oceanococcus sp.]